LVVEERTVPEQSDFPLPADLPRPLDDGGAEHLLGRTLPSILLPSTAGRMVDVSAFRTPRTVIYFYPRTGIPGQPLPPGWDAIPGARGCTPQAHNFQARQQEFSKINVQVFGCSTQTPEYQKELAERLRLPFEILSDAEFKLCDGLRLPTFETSGMRLMKRLTVIVRNSRIEHVFYPVFPPNESADEALRWLQDHPLQA
jgi:peroxiredoxin